MPGPWKSAGLALALAACGTHVETGQNLEKSQFTALETQAPEAGTTPGGGSADQTVLPPDGAGVPGAPGGQGAPLTCFGPAPQLTADFQAFCSQLAPPLQATFQTAYDLICKDKRLVNLTLEPCSWSGSGPSERFRRVLARTELTDQTTQDFRFVGAYAVTTESNLEAQVALGQRELTDPKFASQFVTIKNSRVFNVVKNADGSFDYSAELASSAATVSFRARAQVLKITNDLSIIVDYATGDKVILKEHKLLTILVRLNDSKTRVIALDEKVLADGGNHAVAYQNVTDVLQQRMEREYENSRRD